MTAREAIAQLNAHKCLMRPGETSDLLMIISRAFVMNDADAARWLWLLNWKPQQLVN